MRQLIVKFALQRYARAVCNFLEPPSRQWFRLDITARTPTSR